VRFLSQNHLARDPTGEDSLVFSLSNTSHQDRSTFEVILGFPKLQDTNEQNLYVVPEFFHHMAAEDNGVLKCRIRPDATWTDDGSLDGSIDAKLKAVRALASDFGEDDWTELSAIDRARIQIIYVPAIRNAASQLTSFLKGRIWRTMHNAGTDATPTFLATRSRCVPMGLIWKT
jgi:hypothetical protein